MKNLRSLTCALAALSFSAMTHAAPVQYKITAVYSGEFIWDGTQAVPTNSYLFTTSSTPISATFFYDSATPVTSSDNASTGSLSRFGAYSYYAESISNFSGTVLNYSFSSPTASTLVADGTTSNMADGIFHQIGSAADPSIPATVQLSGFTIADYTLTGFVAYTVGAPMMLSNQTLPVDIAATKTFPILNIGLNLTFVNSIGEYRSATFWNGTITPVPLPNAALFFASGLIGLGANTLRKFKR